ERVGGPVTVENSNGGIEISEAAAGVTATTTFGAVEVHDSAGGLTVANANGPVIVSARPSTPCQPIALKTSFSPMKLYLGDGASYNLTAKTSFGRIHSDLEVAASGTMGADTLAGRIGGGGCELRLTNQNGGIEILKAEGSPAHTARR
ncbi:MAG TPA: hypothetical protein VF767_01450, partial [Bryobacteraceae bacterium]